MVLFFFVKNKKSDPLRAKTMFKRKAEDGPNLTVLLQLPCCVERNHEIVLKTIIVKAQGVPQ